MKTARIEVDPDGELRAVGSEAPRRWLPRRRKYQQHWSEAELRESIVATYVGRNGGLSAATVVIHYPARLVPRRLLRLQRREHGVGWLDWQWWGFAWDSQMWANVQMGDDPIDLVQAFCPHHLETSARDEAREWVGRKAKDVPYFDLPQPARVALRYALARGPGYFFR